MAEKEICHKSDENSLKFVDKRGKRPHTDKAEGDILGMARRASSAQARPLIFLQSKFASPSIGECGGRRPCVLEPNGNFFDLLSVANLITIFAKFPFIFPSMCGLGGT